MLFPPVEQANGSKQHIDSHGNGTWCLGQIHFEIADKQMILTMSTTYAPAFSCTFLLFASLGLLQENPMARKTCPPPHPARWIQVSHPPSSSVFLHKAILGPFHLVNSFLITLSDILGCE